jgi:type VI secretion system protein ImpA
MANLPEGFDLEALLAPLPGAAPAGADLREDFSPQSAYYRLRDARAEARAAERAAEAPDPDQGGGTGGEAPWPAQWRTVRELATKALTAQTKDLEIAAWLTEALVRSDGLAGLEAGARLIAGLAETLWDSNLYPTPDEDGIVTRVAPVGGLNGEGGQGTLMQPLRKVPLWLRPDQSTLGFWRYEQSMELAGIADPARREARLQAGWLPFEDVEREAQAVGRSALSAVRDESAAALAAWQAMSEVLDARAGIDSPRTSDVRELLQQIHSVADKYALAEGGAPAPGGAPAAPQIAGAPQQFPSVGAPGGAEGGATREEMLRQLGRIAEFFRRTEPHSPLAYTLDEAVRRGRMSWPQLLEEIVPDAVARNAIQTALGIKPADAPAEAPAEAG